jgi:hypothetical protein
MAYNRPDPQVYHWFIPLMYLWHFVNSMLTRSSSIFAIFFIQLWGIFVGTGPVLTITNKQKWCLDANLNAINNSSQESKHLVKKWCDVEYVTERLR